MIANRYELGDKIGQGGMGSVYKAHDHSTQQTVAVKILMKDLDDEEYQESLERFKREGEVLRRLEHPNIVDVLDTVEENEKQYIVMEYVSGGSLSHVLKRDDRLSPDRIINIALELSDALARAHHLEVIHRDIKPGNVLLTEDDEPRLTDFGIAHIAGMSRMTEEGHVVGTVSYISPEILRGKQPSPRSDIWAFGVMLFEMLTRQRPFDRNHPMATMQTILTQKPADLNDYRTDIPDALSDLIYRMLEKDVEQRIPSMRQIGAELEAMKFGYALAIPSVAAPVVELGGAGSAGQRLDTDETGLSELAPGSMTRVARNLPTMTTPFVGRTTEVTEIIELLQRPGVSLVTILGPGGMGKTRLSVQVAEVVIEQFRHGVFFVPLAPLSDPDHIVTAISESLRLMFSERQSPKYQLIEYLRNKNMLLVMDNFEHMIEGVDIVSDILKAAPNIKILATSREKLNLRRENIYAIAGMGLPDRDIRTATGTLSAELLAEQPAIQLFVQSAQRVRPDFQLDIHNMPYITRICALVEGMPLAIELSAAWVEMLDVEEIAHEIEQNIDFLESDLRDMPDRHRSMRAVFDYSWQLLNDDERRVFTRLSVFRGAFTREAAQRITGASLRMLMALTNKSLMRRDINGRYELHAMLRQYAETELPADERQDVRAKHMRYYAAMVRNEVQHLKGTRQRQASIAIEAQLQDVRAAWGFAVETADFDAIGEMVEGLNRFFDMLTFFGEGEQAFLEAAHALRPLAETDAQRLILGRVTGRLGWFTRRVKSSEEARKITLASLELLQELGAEEETAFPLVTLAALARDNGDHRSAVRFAADSLKLYRASGDRWGIGFTLYQLADSLREMGEDNRASKAFEESRDVCADIGDLNGIAWANIGLGRIATVQEDYDDARDYYKAALSAAQQMGVQSWVLTQTLQLLGWLGWRYTEDFADALRFYEAAHKIVLVYGTRRQVAESLVYVGMTYAALNNIVQGAPYLHEGVSAALESGYDDLLFLGLVALAYPLTLSPSTDAAMQANIVYWLAIVSEQGPDRLRSLAESLLQTLRPAMAAAEYDEALWQGQSDSVQAAAEHLLELLAEVIEA